MKIRILTIATYILFAAAFGIVFYFAFLMFYPVKYFESVTPYEVMNKNKTVRIGEDLIYRVKYCKYRDYIPARVVRTLVDGYVYDLPVNTATTFPKGCHTIDVSIPIVVPYSLPIDHKYRMEIVVDYKINLLRSETRVFRTEEFTIIK